MVAVRHDVVVERGDTFEYVVDLLDENGDARTDLSGYTASMQIREEQDDQSDLLATATVTVDADNAQATATISKTTTANYDWSAGWYSMHIVNGAGTRSERVAQGRATLSRNVTA